MGNLEKFIASIDSDLAWRKKEISNIILMHNENNSELIVKSAVLLIYSHWEGSVKNLCKLYLCYVANLSIKICDLTNNYKAIALKGRIKQMTDSSESLTMTNELTFIELIGGSDIRFKLNNTFRNNEKDKSIINTDDNLSYNILLSFFRIIGIGEKDCLQTTQNYIDSKLLLNRNKVAHGNKIDSSDDEFDLDIESIKKIKSLIFSIIDSLGEDLKHYAENQYFLSSKNSEIMAYNEGSNDELEKIIDTLDL